MNSTNVHGNYKVQLTISMLPCEACLQMKLLITVCYFMLYAGHSSTINWILSPTTIHVINRFQQVVHIYGNAI